MNTHILKNSEILLFLAKHYDTDVENIKETFSNEKATTYLVVWSIFEPSVSNGFLKIKDIKDIAQKYSSKYSSLNIDSITKKFYDRYQDEKKLRNLVHSQSNPNIKEILSKQYSDLQAGEKMELLLFVVYRYRNNIFHGNKGVLSWQHYTEQIDDCLAFMMKMIDITMKCEP